ncbi:MAG: hypothetical protein IPK12_04245 [Gemmatimonadetes bacterium]|nr:hypothetical protein [Gemmatimonadota bacterium]
MTTLKYAPTSLAALALLAACAGDGSGPSVGGRQVAFQVATSEKTAAPAAALLGPETIALGNDTIVLTSVQIVLREIELTRVGGSACDTTLTDDDCEELEIGPILLDLPLTAGADRQFTVVVDTGTYDEIEFEVHKPESSDDAGFLAANPEFDGRSIKVVGSWNGTPFTFYSDLNVEQEYDINPPLVVTDAAGASVTLRVDIARWFANQANSGLIDPASANKGGQYEGEVKSNIEASINAFEDDDHDGEDDSTDDD